MPNIAAAIRQLRKDKKRRLRNRAVKTGVRTAIKKVKISVAERNAEALDKLLKEAIPAIDKAVSKHVFHRKTASRLISRLVKHANKARGMQQPA